MCSRGPSVNVQVPVRVLTRKSVVAANFWPIRNENPTALWLEVVYKYKSTGQFISNAFLMGSFYFNAQIHHSDLCPVISPCSVFTSSHPYPDWTAPDCTRHTNSAKVLGSAAFQSRLRARQSKRAIQAQQRLCTFPSSDSTCPTHTHTHTCFKTQVGVSRSANVEVNTKDNTLFTSPELKICPHSYQLVDRAEHLTVQTVFKWTISGTVRAQRENAEIRRLWVQSQELLESQICISRTLSKRNNP